MNHSILSSLFCGDISVFTTTCSVQECMKEKFIERSIKKQYYFIPAYTEGLSEMEWGAIISGAFTITAGELDETEMVYNKLIEGLGEGAKNKIMKYFMTMSPPLVKCLEREATSKILLIVFRNMSKPICFFLNIIHTQYA